MTLDAVRTICRALPSVTEDVKWGHDLCFLVGGKMFTVVDLEPPHSIAFKCTPETFGELVERPGIIPAPYMARNMWVQEQELGAVLDRRELEPLVKTSYDLVVATLPKSRRPGAPATPAVKRARSKNTAPKRASLRRTSKKPARRPRSKS
jgi:predicted DNA-binding protein (MmcQ/YjbR family)